MSVSHNNVDTNSLCDASYISLNLEKINKKGGTSLQQRNCLKMIMAQCCCNDKLLQISLLALLI